MDLGSSGVRCVIGMQEPDSPAPSIVGFGEAPNKGVRKGVVVDIEETVSAITTAVDEAVRIAGINIQQATVGVNGQHVISLTSHGIIAVGSGNREITEQDLSRVEEAATVIQLPPNRETIQAFARNYQIDGQEQISDPLGMSGMRLEVDTCLITAATPFLKNLTRSAQQAGLHTNSLVPNPLASATTLVNSLHKEKGAVLLDIGASTTGLAVFEDGELLHVAVLPVGSGHITNDLAIGLRTEIETAEKVKIKHVDCSPKQISSRIDSNIKVKELNGEFLLVSRREINTIAQARLEELFGLVDEELKKINRDGMLPGGAILCGGGAKLTNIDEFAKSALRLPAQAARPFGFSGVIDKVADPSYACAIGLMIEDIKLHNRGNFGLSNVSELAQPIIKGFKNLYAKFKK